MRFVATGDSFITRRMTEKEQDQDLMSLIGEADCRFTNLEVTTHHYEGYPSAMSGGTWAIAPPTVLSDLKYYQFNCVTWANNHTLDYLYGGLEATERYLDEAGFVHAGVGKHLDAAAAPKYLESPAGRIAIIGATSTFHEFWRAGKQRGDSLGRPGVNPLRYQTTFYLNQKNMEHLQQVAAVTGINAEHELAVKEGFALAGAQYKFGDYSFELSEEEGMKRHLHEGDVKRIRAAIANAKRQADYVLMSIHTHEMGEGRKDVAPDFLEDFARLCIDEGAHAVIGHGPHIVRGIEIYKNRPIFYSLGNFIFQNDTVATLPHDFYEQYGIEGEATVADALDIRSANGTRGLGVNKKVWESVVPLWEMEDGKLTSLRLHPIELGFGLPRYERGWPKLSANLDVLYDLQRLSEPYGTKITIKDGVGHVSL
ncbi:CapA family protein [Halalkalibacter oceani]